MPPRINGRSAPRQISAGLESILLDTLGLAAAIEWHAHRFRLHTGVLCELTVDPAAPVNLAEERAAAVFKFCNEALSHAARHARPGRLAVALTLARHEATVKISLPLP